MPKRSPTTMIDGQHQRPEAVDDRPDDLAQRFARRACDILAARDPPPGEAQADAEHEAGKDAGQEQLRDRDAAGDAEQHEADARRNDRRDDAAGGDEAGRVHLAVAGRDHHRHEQRGQRGGVGGGRAGQRGEHAGRRGW